MLQQVFSRRVLSLVVRLLLSIYRLRVAMRALTHQVIINRIRLIRAAAMLAALWVKDWKRPSVTLALLMVLLQRLVIVPIRHIHRRKRTRNRVKRKMCPSFFARTSS